jgi:hypothetical protein
VGEEDKGRWERGRTKRREKWKFFNAMASGQRMF